MNKDEKLLEELKLIYKEIERATNIQFRQKVLMAIFLGGLVGILEKKLVILNWYIFVFIFLIILTFLVSDNLIWRTYISNHWKMVSKIRKKLEFTHLPAWPRAPSVTASILFGLAIALVFLRILIHLLNSY